MEGELMAFLSRIVPKRLMVGNGVFHLCISTRQRTKVCSYVDITV